MNKTQLYRLNLVGQIYLFTFIIGMLVVYLPLRWEIFEQNQKIGLSLFLFLVFCLLVKSVIGMYDEIKRSKDF